jgi:hypothetical protein
VPIRTAHALEGPAILGEQTAHLAPEARLQVQGSERPSCPVYLCWEELKRYERLASELGKDDRTMAERNAWLNALELSAGAAGF